MTADYSENRITGKTLLAFILLFTVVAAFFYGGYCVAESSAHHSISFPRIPEGMYLTFIKDVSLKDSGSDTVVHIYSGTVISPSAFHGRSMNFYYSENKEALERFKTLDIWDQLTRAKEMEVYRLDAGFDCFVEQKQLERICDEVENETRAMQSRDFKVRFEPVIIRGVILLAIGLYLTYAFSMLKWHAFLYVVDIIGLIVIFMNTLSNMCH